VYSARLPDGRRERFGSSGLLYRANKLMFDRGSFTLWHNLTGEAVLGPGAAAGLRLVALPVTVTSWGAWRRAQPTTTAVVLPAGYGARWGFDYLPGAADRHRAGVRFPVWQRSARLRPQSEILGVRVGGAAKAYPVEAAVAAAVINDRIDGEAVVVIAEPAGGGLRVFRRGEREFRRDRQGVLRDEAGGAWREEEAALVPVADGDEPALARLASHHAFWFGWFGFFPETEVWEPPSG
jgi:hypothetical protein